MNDVEPIEMRLEDMRGLSQGVSMEVMALTSAAISLKRIADFLEGIYQRTRTDDVGN